MAWALLAVAAAVLAALAVWWRRRPWAESHLDVDDTCERIRTLVTCCEVGAATIAASEQTPIAIEIRLDHADASSVSVSFGLPGTTWTSERLDRARAAAAESGFAVETVADDPPSSTGVRARFVRRDRSDDAVVAATSWFRRLTELLELGEEASFRVHTEGDCSGPRVRAHLRGRITTSERG